MPKLCTFAAVRAGELLYNPRLFKGFCKMSKETIVGGMNEQEEGRNSYSEKNVGQHQERE